MKFRSRSDYSHERHFRSYPLTEPNYVKKFNPDTGEEEVIVDGQVNVYEIKQEALADTMIYNQIDRYQRTGDLSFLGTSVDSFIDTLAMPQTLMDVENIKSKASNLWSVLPRQLKDEYGNNMATFMKNVDARLIERKKIKQAEQRAAVKEGVNE